MCLCTPSLVHIELTKSLNCNKCSYTRFSCKIWKNGVEYFSIAAVKEDQLLTSLKDFICVKQHSDILHLETFIKHTQMLFSFGWVLY
jgi:hypothetical protein